MKHITKLTVFVLLLLLSVCALVLTACGGETVLGISVESANMPRLSYVEGQDLDLSGALLSVQGKGGVERISLTDPDVSVTGYDRNRVGKQEVTVSYKGQTTTFFVTVVAHLSAEGLETNYFIGEEFNSNRGVVRITNDDLTSFTVPLNDPTVTVEGFDSGAAVSQLPLTLTYRSGETQYTGTVAVNVYDYSNVDFTAPSRTAYKSYETALNLEGGYLTIKADGGKVSRSVALTQDMISGFDPSLSTEENRTQPLEQTVTVRYAGQQFPFTVRITYSDVTTIRDAAEILGELDWDGEELPVLNAVQGAVALDALDVYRNLSNSDRKYVTGAECAVIIRAAAVYGYGKWQAAYDACTFLTHTDAGFVLADGTTLAAATEGLAHLRDTNADLYVWGVRLHEMISEFGAEIIRGELTVKEFLSGVYAPADFDAFCTKIQASLDLYGLAARIPADWTPETLQDTENAAVLAQMLDSIGKNNYASPEDPSVVTFASSWLAADDLPKMLTAYCFLQQDAEALNTLGGLYVPASVALAHLYAKAALEQMLAIARGYQDPSNITVYDTTSLMLYYNRANTYANAAVSDSASMECWIFNNLTFSDMGAKEPVTVGAALTYLYQGNWGYRDNLSGIVGDETLTAFYNSYMNLAGKYISEEYTEFSAFFADADALFRSFTALSGAQQLAFMKSVNAYYRYGYPSLALSLEEKPYTLFSAFFGICYESLLPEEAHPAFEKLLVAMERYMQYTAGADISAFFDAMEEVNAARDALGADSEGRTAYDRYVSFLYDRYAAYAALYTENGDWAGSALPSEWEAKLTDLSETLGQFSSVYTTISSKRVDLYAVLFAAYERANVIGTDILTNAPDGVLQVFYSMRYHVFGTNSSCTLDYALSYCRSVFMSCMQTMTYGGYSLWSVYSSADLSSFMAEAYYMLDTTYKILMSGSMDEGTVYYTDKAQIYAAMAAYRQLSAFGKMIFSGIDSNDVYYRALSLFFGENLSENAYAVALKLIGVEKVYRFYQYTPEGSYEDGEGNKVTYEQRFAEVMEDCDTALAALTEADRSAFMALLGDMYDYYAAAYASIGAAGTDTPDTSDTSAV